MGFVIVVLMGVYLMLSVFAVTWAISHAKKNGLSVKKWGWGTALVMYLIPFWDWLPTVAVHQYYCAKDSGFWVYKTLDQWKAENPGVIEGLVSYNKNPGEYNANWPSQQEISDDGHLKINVNHINERFDEIVSQQDVSNFVSVIRKKIEFVDIKRKVLVARYVDFGTGNSVKNTIGLPGPLKFWLHNSGCIGGRERQIEFGDFYLKFKGAEK